MLLAHTRRLRPQPRQPPPFDTEPRPPDAGRERGEAEEQNRPPLHRPPSVEVAACRPPRLRHHPPQAHAPGLDRLTPPVPNRPQKEAPREGRGRRRPASSSANSSLAAAITSA
ncbi:hypothetical protein BDA96_04G186800 [Sorghum bicolor]|uniref:Uncharacterized protein n=1 Tax=Sorghum bicolor TaxID=4558 RepID=A0A921R500_SORBI|nr:hypothetical protein BDA96_04G186800 [Sorghum bicolor]